MNETILDEPLYDRPRIRKKYYDWVEIPIAIACFTLSPGIMAQSIEQYIKDVPSPELKEIITFSCFNSKE